jgi:hypothetical protein
LAAGVPADVEVGAGHATAAAFLDPILAGEVASGVWDPHARAWIGA